MAASNGGHTLTVVALLNAGADPDVAGLTVGPFGMLYSESPLEGASNGRHAKTAEALLKAGANPNAAAVTVGPFGLISSESSLFSATMAAELNPPAMGHLYIEMLTTLLNAGANPNAAGQTLGPFGVFLSGSPLGVASNGGHVEMVANLLKAGADPYAAGATAGPFGLIWSRSPLNSATWFLLFHTNPSYTDSAVQKLLEDAQTIAGTKRTGKTEL
jgi:ankyrin repeat protein